jgi:hypothetical protein
MLEIIGLPENAPFSIALSIVAIFAVIEIVGMLIGMSVLSVGDDLFDIEIPDVDADVEWGVAFINWTKINQVPLMVWLTVFLLFFGFSGIILTQVVDILLGVTLPLWVSVPMAFVTGFLETTMVATFIAKIIPSVETSAVHSDDFVGNVAQITIGTATAGNPAEAKFIDDYNQAHFVLVVPMEENESFAQGERVVLIKKESSVWVSTRYLDVD